MDKEASPETCATPIRNAAADAPAPPATITAATYTTTTSASSSSSSSSLHEKGKKRNPTTTSTTTNRPTTNNLTMGNEKRPGQLVVAREAPRFGPCVANSDAIWDEICICHQSAQYHLAEYTRLYKSIYMAPANLVPAAEDDIDLVRLEDLSSSPDAWRLKVERDFAMRDLRVVRDRLALLARPRPRLSRGALGVSTLSFVGLVAANHLSAAPAVLSHGFVVSLLVSVFCQVAPWLRRAAAAHCAASVSAVLDRVRDFACPDLDSQWPSARWLELLRWFPDDGGACWG